MHFLTLSERVVHVFDFLVFHEVSLRSHVVVSRLNFRWTNSRDFPCVLGRLWSHVIGGSSVSLVESQAVDVGLLEFCDWLRGVEAAISDSIIDWC